MATSLIPDGTIDTFPFVGDKVTTMLQGIRTTDNGASYSSFTPTFSTITNSTTMTNEPSGNVVFMSATTANEPTQSTPKEVLKVLDKVIASNSHSIYKDALIVNGATGKVSVGNGSNPYESKVLENALLDENDFITTIPTHTPIQLDNSDSPACKWFYALSVKNKQYFFDIYYKELVWDFGLDSSTEVTDINVSGDTTITAQTSKLIRWTSPDAGYLQDVIIERVDSFSGWSANLLSTVTAVVGNELRRVDNTKVLLGYIWDGNGFQDNNKFDDLSKCLSIPTGVYRK